MCNTWRCHDCHKIGFFFNMLLEDFQKKHEKECLGLTPEIEKQARDNVEALGSLAACAFPYVPHLLNEIDWLRDQLKFLQSEIGQLRNDKEYQDNERTWNWNEPQL